MAFKRLWIILGSLEFGIKPNISIASRTRCRVSSETRVGRLSTFETVPSETLASFATSRRDGFLLMPRRYTKLSRNC